MLEVIQAEHVGVDLGDRVGALRRKDRSARFGAQKRMSRPGDEIPVGSSSARLKLVRAADMSMVAQMTLSFNWKNR
jgi:hypothetical protein